MCCSDSRLSCPQGGTLDFLILMNKPAPSRRWGRPLISPSFPFLFPWSEFTNSKANSSRVPKFNLINTLCGDLQQHNVLPDRHPLRVHTALCHRGALSYTETSFFQAVLTYIQNTDVLKFVNIPWEKYQVRWYKYFLQAQECTMFWGRFRAEFRDDVD